jgi:hypothetical protein
MGYSISETKVSGVCPGESQIVSSNRISLFEAALFSILKNDFVV